MGVLFKEYDYERSTIQHKAFLRMVYECLSKTVEITAKLKYEGTFLYMLVVISERVNELTGYNIGLPHIWLTENEIAQPNPYHHSDRRIQHALYAFKLEIEQPDFLGPNKSVTQ